MRLRLSAVTASMFLGACSTQKIVTPPLAQGCRFAAVRNEVTCDGKPFATIKTYFCYGASREDFTHSCSSIAGDCDCRGLAVLYVDGTVAWLYWGGGLADALVSGHYHNKGDCETKGLCMARTIRLASDGASLRWWDFFTTYEYAIGEGVRRKVD